MGVGTSIKKREGILRIFVMIDPTSSREHARALIGTVSRHLGMKRADLLHLYSQMQLQDDPCGSFCAACLHLEQDDSPVVLQLMINEREAIKFKIDPLYDPRFALLYLTIDSFYKNSSDDFLTRNRVDYHKSPRFQPTELTKPEVAPVTGRDPFLDKEWVDPFETEPSEGVAAPTIEMKDDPEDEGLTSDPLAEQPTASLPAHAKVGIQRSHVQWNEQQDKAFAAVFAWMRNRGRKQIFRLFGFAGTGKEQPISCEVQTLNGPRRIGDLRVGDRILGRNGKSTTVLGVFPQGKKDVYQVTFKDKTSTRCGLEHLWTVIDKRGNERTMSLRELLEAGITFPGGGYKFKVPLCAPVQYRKKPLPIHPYVLGVVLGNGYLRGNTLTITNSDRDSAIIDRVRQLAPRFRFKPRQTTEHGIEHKIIDPRAMRSKMRTPVGHPLRRNRSRLRLEALGLLGLRSRDRFIPEDYLYSTVEDRWELLRGLMDTDGSARPNNGAVFCTMSKRLAQDVTRLVQSLGGMTIPHKDCGHGIELNIETFENPFWNPRKASRWSLSKQNGPARTIVKIEKLGKEQQVCIKVSARDELYLTDNYIVTHNTTMAREIAWNVETGENGLPRGPVLFAAYTGKAASILRSKGCADASTIHSLIYKPVIDPETGRTVDFIINPESPLVHARLLIVDEISMVDAKMAKDILSFGVPVLVLGDPEQLEPIEGLGFFTQGAPDIMLTKVERQKDNPVLWLATRVRERKTIKPGRYGSSVVLPSGTHIEDELLLANDQILVGTRRTRDALNKRYRKLKGYYAKDSQFPTKGERLLCLKNNKNNGLLNGTLWTCTQPKFKMVQRMIDFRNPSLGMEDTNVLGLHFKVRSLDMTDSEGGPLIVNTVCSSHMFDPNVPEPPWRLVAQTDQFGFAYAMTVHKGQGSQWDTGILVDESGVFPEQSHKHQYTGLTRFVDSVVWRLP